MLGPSWSPLPTAGEAIVTVGNYVRCIVLLMSGSMRGPCGVHAFFGVSGILLLLMQGFIARGELLRATTVRSTQPRNQCTKS